MDPMEQKKYQIAVIGAGPGGYVAAIRAALAGQSVALIEKEFLGGVCLNWGCIPTKTLIAGAEVLHKVKNAAAYGIEVGPVAFHYNKMKERKDGVVSKIRASLEGLIKSHKVQIIKGTAEITGPHEIKILGEHPEIIEAEKIIVASGSRPKEIAAFPFDYKKIHDSTSILELTELPKKLAIVGGGVIGCEFASLFAELGVEVVILEALSSILPLEAKAVSTFLTQAFAKKGIKIHTGIQVQSITCVGEGVRVQLASGETIVSDAALVAIGRSLNVKGLGLEKAAVFVDEKGFVPVNEKMQTNIPHIYAIGDITNKALLAHVASHQGIVAAIHATGGSAKMHYEAVPNVIFTHPEIATVGLSLEKAQEAGYKAVIGKFPFQALGKAIAALETEGFAQIIIDQPSGKILGAQVIGQDAANLIAPLVLAIQNELTIESITDTIHAHPTLAEAWLEAALIGVGTPIHFPPQTKK